MFAGLSDLLQTITDAFFIINMGCGDGRHTDDSIHRCSYIVRHIGQEVCLCFICRFRSIKCGLKRHLLLAFLFDQIIHAPGPDHRRPAAVLFVDKGHPHLDIADSLFSNFFIGEGIILGSLLELFQSQLFHKIGEACLRYDFPGVFLHRL